MKKVTFIIFLLFLFFLPLYEAPKNIFSVSFVFFGIFVALSEESAFEVFRSKSAVALAFLLLSLSPFLAGISSPYTDLGFLLSSALNWSLMPLVGLVLVLVKFHATQLNWSLRVLSLGTFVAVCEAFFSWSGEYPELNSVGHVNQSALYLGLSIIPAGLLVLRNDPHYFDWFLALATATAVLAYQGPARSMIGFGATMIGLGGIWLVFCLYSGHFKLLTLSMLVAAVTSILLIQVPSSAFGPYEEFKVELDQRLSSEHDPFSQRDRLMNAAFEIGKGSLFGSGLGSFGEAVTMDKLKASVEARGGVWSEERKAFFSSSHGHNIFSNVLVERGWFGVASIGLFLGAMAIIFVRRLASGPEAMVGLVVITVIVLAGLGQSTLHVEHGQLAFVLMAVCLSLGRAQRYL